MAELAEGAFERIRKAGAKTASSIDLLTVALSRYADDVPANEPAAAKLINKYRPSNLGDVSAAELNEALGLEPFEIERFRSALELGRRSATAAKGEREVINNSKDVAAYFDWLKDEPKEHFCALYLTSKSGIIKEQTVHIGTLNMSVVGPREVFRMAVHESAASVIVVHNHPSGDPEPSPEDIQVTKKLVAAGRLLDIQLLDHVIIGHHGYVSLNERGVV
ncbi:MAG: RadC family protein [Fimbriimonadaceae bacterium]